jgi:MOSC domain-containing protein YiiM
MRVLSVNVGLPKDVEWHGRKVRTAIYKQPVEGRVAVGRLHLVGDAQADLTVHGGVYKAVYAYPSEHYPAWREELGRPDLPWGAFGENLTLEGLVETDVAVGDRLRIGTVELVVTQPRQPCHKLAIRFQRQDIGKLFWASGRTGFYLAVTQEGELGAGDAVEHLPAPGPRLPLAAAG